MMHELESVKEEIFAWRKHKKYQGERIPPELRKRIYALSEHLCSKKIKRELGLGSYFSFSSQASLPVEEKFIEVGPNLRTAASGMPSVQITGPTGIQVGIFL